MLTVSDLTKSYAGRVLFQEASIQLNAGERLGLIGPNGAGKSTLFSLILKENSPDEGEVSLQRGTTVGFLPQESAPSGDETILQLATSIHGDDDHYDAGLEAQAKRILSGLAFRESDFDRPARTMSGGWIMRAHLARLLVMEPDLLMLDEPTNHLDLESLGWFQNHLRNYRGAILAISHDREFLNAICQGILEISHKKLNRYKGNYDAYLELKAAREEQHLAAYRNQQKEIEHLQDFINRFRAKASKAAQAQERIKRLDKMVRIEPPERAEATVHFKFPQPPRSGQRVMMINEVRQAYGDHVIYDRLHLTVERGQRTVLVGPNGAGKSTLLKIIAGMVPILAGTVEAGHNVSIGYFAQHRTDMLDTKRTVLDEAMAISKPIPEQAARTILGSFLFRGDDVFKTVGVLSGGEKSRLALVKLLLDPPNLILLDEPTTHLDMASIDALIGALKHYEGTLLFVSHDVHFIRALATTVLHVDAGHLTPYAGDYNYFLDKSKALSDRGGLVAKLHNHRPEESRTVTATPVAAPVEPKLGMKEIREQRRLEAEKAQAAARAKRSLEARANLMEKEVVELEARQKAVAVLLEDPAVYSDNARAMQLNQQLAFITKTLEKATADWEEATTALSAVP